MYSKITLSILLLFVTGLSYTTSHCLNCLNKCSGETCDEFGCKPGYYGDKCSKECSKTCLGGILHRSICNRSTGSCLNGCTPGYYGEFCENQCSPGCFLNNCDHVDGICISGCKQRKHGPRCTKDCSKTCRNQECDQNGRCFSCRRGFYGPFCSDPCPRHCRCNTCQVEDNGSVACACKDDLERRLKRDTGEANTTNCCENGYNFNDCSIPCTNCKVKKPNNSTCFPYCEKGYFGVEHSDPCNKKCNKNCAEGCDMNDGHCSAGCRSGYHGRSCQSICSRRCRNSVCVQETGYCRDCKNSTFGDNCDHDCSESCTERFCDRRNGTCIKECPRDKYGAYCNHTCSENCENSACTMTQRGNPVCTDRCMKGFYGRYCQEICPPKCDQCHKYDGTCQDSPIVSPIVSQTTIIIILSVLLCLFVAVCFLLGYIVYRRRPINRSRSSHNGRRDDSPHDAGRSERQPTGERIPLTSVVDCSDYQQTEEAPPTQESEEGARNDGKNDPQKVNGGTESRRSHSCTRPESVSLGLSKEEMQDVLSYIGQEDNNDSLTEFWEHLGYSKENIPLNIEGNNYGSLLEAAPVFQGAKKEQVIYKLILALRFANMSRIADKLVASYRGLLPREFLEELHRKECCNENTENEAIYYGMTNGKLRADYQPSDSVRDARKTEILA